MRVLVVDDEDAGRYLAESILKSGGHEVAAASDGIEALEVAAEFMPDVVISDILMPRMDGYQLVREWKIDPRFSGIPLIFYTASYTDPADEKFALDLGADGFLGKPVEAKILLKAVDDVTSGDERGLPREPVASDETEVLREYSHRLVNKLEHKVLDLERANVMLKGAMEALNDEIGIKLRLIDDLNVEVETRKTTAEELKRYQLRAENSQDIIVSIRPDGRLVDVNAAAVDAYGISREKLIGSMGYLLRADPDSGPRYGTMPLEGRRFEQLHRRADGSVFPTEVSAYGIEYDGAPLFLDIIRDITERKHDEEERVRLEQTKTNFISMISHELRTPLTSIIGYSDILADMDISERPDAAHTAINKIQGNGRRMQDLVEELLGATQMQLEGISLTVQDVDAGAFIERLTSDLSLAETHSLKLDIQEGLPPIRVDEEQMSRALGAVLGNSVKYSPNGGEIAVRVRSHAESVTIAVEDHGVGMSAEKAPQLFLSFTQLDMSSTRTFGGVGLGLFLAYQIVTAHGGTIMAESQEGVGSTFTITLPQGD
ncbi:MAG: ATP-binding protein [Actinomycetota bacterium]|jgi:PAS domain S-box-containing protein|nr:ATP-binding protein [Actinomycetota bacterium]